MNRIFHLSSCSTCQRIIKELDSDTFELIDIKTNHIDEETLDDLATRHGGYEALFNKRAIKYRSEGWKEKTLTEEDFKKLILNEYTFLKRPIIFINGESFVGNAKNTVAAAKLALENA